MPALLQREACLLTGSWHACCMHPPAVVPPIDQWLNSYYFTVDGVNFPTSWVNLMYVGTDPTGVLLNGASVPAADWSRAAGLANWWTARKQLTVTAGTEVTYTLRHTNASETLGFLIYGLGTSSSFAMPGGYAVRDLRLPEARCTNRVVAAGPACFAAADVNNGSLDPQGGAVTLAQDPAGPYPPGVTNVTLRVTDSGGLSSSCSALVTVQVRVAWPPGRRPAPSLDDTMGCCSS
jgi:hypothetical protein